MEAQNLRFCRECGREIVDDYGFCTACGAVYDRRAQGVPSGNANVRTETATGPTDEERAAQAYMVYMDDLRERMYISNLKLTVVMLAIWVALAAVIAAGLLTGFQPLMDFVRNSFNMGNNPLAEGTIIAASGVLALVSAHLCSQKKRWNVAFYTCFASTLLTAPLIVFDSRICIYFFLCGLLASLRVRNLRPIFE